MRVINGDCKSVLLDIDYESVDACITDPPYGISFMGYDWDHEVPGVPYWAAVKDVLKPGAHLLAFCGTRKYHRMACAIEDAGFEIRDTLAWIYGQGFPKGYDVARAIDAVDASGDSRGRKLRFTEFMRATGLTSSQIDKITGTSMGGHYTTSASQPAVATREHFEALRPYITIPIPPWIEEMVDQRTVESENLKRRQKIGKHTKTPHVSIWRENLGFGEAGDPKDITVPFTPEAAEWDGWSTSLKPAMELIVMARKPLVGTIADNVLRDRTGAINCGGCMIDTDDDLNGGAYAKVGNRKVSQSLRQGGGMNQPGKTTGKDFVQPAGRWPPNVTHDGSDAVISMFPSVDISRFFYTAKANEQDRFGSAHPTVKPVSLMRWLVRLVTPPGGTVIDPFAGSGTTGDAAMQEGCDAILIEQQEKFAKVCAERLAEEVEVA